MQLVLAGRGVSGGKSNSCLIVVSASILFLVENHLVLKLKNNAARYALSVRDACPNNFIASKRFGADFWICIRVGRANSDKGKNNFLDSHKGGKSRPVTPPSPLTAGTRPSQPKRASC